MDNRKADRKEMKLGSEVEFQILGSEVKFPLGKNAILEFLGSEVKI